MKIRKIITIILFVLAAISMIAAKNSEFIAEYIFARGIFKVFSVPIGFVTGLFPFSLAELLITGFIVFAIYAVVRLIIMTVRTIKAIRRREYRFSASKLRKFTWNVAFVLSIGVFSFCILCGTNYYRYDFEKYCDFTIGEYTTDDLYDLCIYLAEKTTNSRKEVTEKDKNGIMVLSESFYKTSGRASKAMRSLSKDYPSVAYVSGRVKPVMGSKFMSYTEIVGVYCPFTLEANVNDHVPDYSIPATMCHELAHLSGYMKEDEANYIAYLACINSEDAEFVYSGYALAYIYASNELYDIDKDKYDEVSKLLSEDVIKDMIDEYEYWKQYRETKAGQVISEVSNSINNGYLVMNGQEDGVKSYGKMVTLLIADFLRNRK